MEWGRGTRVLVLAILLLLAGSLSYIALAPNSAGPHSAAPSSVSCAPSTGSGPNGNWSTYHGDNSRSGIAPGSGITAASPAWAGSVRLDGQV
ncbi:MAG: hypothetical protein WB809_05020, partial [Thermoplasmata archaeon]